MQILGRPASWHPSSTPSCLGVLVWAGQFVRIDQDLPADARAAVPATPDRNSGRAWDDFVLVLLACGRLRR